MTKHKLNYKRRKKMRRKIKRQDVGWEKVLIDITVYEINLEKEGKQNVIQNQISR